MQRKGNNNAFAKGLAGGKPPLKFGPFKLDERALSSLITTAGMLAIIIMVISAVLNTLVPQWAKEDESEHMDEELRNYLTLRTNIYNLIEQEDVDITISPRFKLGASGNIPIGVIPSSGKLTFNPFDNDTKEEVTRYNDPLSIYSKGGGNIEYKASNNYYQDQTIIYEHGAVLVSQPGGSVMKAGPRLTVTKSPLLNDTRSFGFFDPGTKDNRYEKTFNFAGRHGNVTLTYEVFDVDLLGEVLIKLNRQAVALAPVTGDENWSKPQTVNLSGDLVNDFSINKLEFNQTTGTGSEEWGIRNVTLSGNFTDIDLTMVTLIGNKEDIGGRDSHTIQAKLLAQELNTYDWPDENLTLNFTTLNPEAWEQHLESMLENTENLQWSSDPQVTDYSITTRKITEESYVVSVTFKNVNHFDCTIAIVRINLG